MSDSIAILRVVDAAANRAAEGLRVIEDYTRFVLDDRHLTGMVKSLRHDLTTSLASVGSDRRHAARDSVGDIGLSISTPSEQQRAGLKAVVAANFKRVEQSLRSLEEFAKLLSTATLQAHDQTPDANMAAGFEQLRYRTYTLERAVDINRYSSHRLANCRLYILCDGRDSVEQFDTVIRQLVSARVHAIQLRDKTLSDRVLIERARRMRALTRGTGTLFIMNDRPDLARLVDADGVHIGQDELSVKDARMIVGPDALIGVSTHSLDQARQAVIDGANYIGVGPTFPSRTKQFEAHVGVELLSAVAAEVCLPAFAIGGIDATNISQVLATGMTRVAVSAAVINALDPAEAVNLLLNKM